MKKSVFTIALAAAVVALMAGAAFSWQGWGGRHMMGPGYGYGMMGPGYGHGMMGPGYGYGPGGGGPGFCRQFDDDLDLSDEQYEKLDQLRTKFQDETRPLRREINAKHRALEKLYESDEPDTAAVEKLEREIFDLAGQLREKGFNFRTEARKIAPELDQWEGRGYGRQGGPGWMHRYGRGGGRWGGGGCPRF